MSSPGTDSDYEKVPLPVSVPLQPQLDGSHSLQRQGSQSSKIAREGVAAAAGGGRSTPTPAALRAGGGGTGRGDVILMSSDDDAGPPSSSDEGVVVMHTHSHSHEERGTDSASRKVWSPHTTTMVMTSTGGGRAGRGDDDGIQFDDNASSSSADLYLVTQVRSAHYKRPAPLCVLSVDVVGAVRGIDDRQSAWTAPGAGGQALRDRAAQASAPRGAGK